MYFASLYHLKRMQQTKESTVSFPQAPVWWPGSLQRFVEGVQDLFVSAHLKREQAYFQQTVSRAYQRFAKQYPTWASSLFDQHFLTTHAAPRLMAIYRRGRWPTAQELSMAWLAQLESQSEEKKIGRCAEARPIAEAFLAHLQTEWSGAVRVRAALAPQTKQVVDQVRAERTLQRHLPMWPATVLTCLPVPGDLGPRNYLDLIAKAQAIYRRGESVLLLDMGAVAALGASGLFALYNIARIFNGLVPQDPAAGWSALSELAHDEQMQTQPRVKLLHVQPAVGQVLSSAGYSAWLQEE